MKLINWDCLEGMDKLIEQWIKVDAIITDPPYWTTACKWDTIIPFDKMWERLNKLIKPNGAIVLFWSEPFSSALRMSNIKNYKYDWIWDKARWYNFQQANYSPLKSNENISVFSFANDVYSGGKQTMEYNPQKTEWKSYISNWWQNSSLHKNSMKPLWKVNSWRFPKTIIQFKKDRPSTHPTQKPVALMEYLIKTYTLENETVLDFTMWSWSTGVACANTNREFIWIELDKDYFDIANIRILFDNE